MSTVPVPQPRSRPPSSTREQLDELDALLQRMLELPVEPTGGDGEPSEEPAPTLAAVEVAPPPPAVPAPETPPPSPPPSVASAPLPSPSPVRLGMEAAPPWLRPLIRLNRRFDDATVRLGTPGRWLRGPHGRALLGWTGLGLLAAALALGLLGWSGWF